MKKLDPESPRISAWLQQFEAQDIETAKLLIRSLELVETSEVELWLETQALEFARGQAVPVALYAARSMDPGEKYFLGRGSSPVPCGHGRDGTGSDAMVANLVTRLARANRELFLDHPSLDVMANIRCRSILLLDDVVGSGRTAREFVLEFAGNRTVRSWLSGKLVNLHYFSYLTYSKAPFLTKMLRADAARRKIQVSRSPDLQFYYCHWPGRGRSSWTPSENRRIDELCRKYSERLGHGVGRTYWAGYGKCMGMVIMEHSCPNNAPSILWFENDKGSFAPLFPRKGVLKSALNDSGASVTASPDVLDLLRALSQGVRRPQRLAELLGTTTQWVIEAATRLQKVGYATPELRCTALGRAEVKDQTSTMTPRNFEARLRPDQLYFPRSLRSARTTN